MNTSPPSRDPRAEQRVAPELSRLTDEQLAENLRALMGTNSPEAVDRLQELVHELQAHRVELEVQNRSLQEARAELEHSIQRYADLYDHLPVAYVTVTPAGEVVHANLAATELFGCERRRLAGVFLGKFLEPYDA
ncbi:MAG: PAS domain-containing protein, partial [Opitutaceae bacterium]